MILYLESLSDRGNQSQKSEIHLIIADHARDLGIRKGHQSGLTRDMRHTNLRDEELGAEETGKVIDMITGPGLGPLRVGLIKIGGDAALARRDLKGRGGLDPGIDRGVAECTVTEWKWAERDE